MTAAHPASHATPVRYTALTQDLATPALREHLLTMMQGLYQDDPAADPVDTARFHLTIDLVLQAPDRGQITVFFSGPDPVGYAIIMPYWSNEFGGWIAFIDELYVRPTHRGRGIATGFIEHTAAAPPFEARLLMLEVTANNDRARRLYTSLGFKERTNRTMARTMAHTMPKPLAPAPPGNR